MGKKGKKLKRRYREAKASLSDLEKRGHRGMSVGVREYRMAEQEVTRTGRKLSDWQDKKRARKNARASRRPHREPLYGLGVFGGWDGI